MPGYPEVLYRVPDLEIFKSSVTWQNAKIIMIVAPEIATGVPVC